MIRLFALAIPGASIAIWLLISALSNFYVERVISRDAGDKALNWGIYMSERVPELKQLIATGIPSPEQKQVIRQLRNLGDVFRFKIFNAEGRLVVVSDEAAISDPNGVSDTHEAKAKAVARTLEANIAVHDGTQKENRPDLYAEAYVPLLDRFGKNTGVIEVYVDVTSTQSYFCPSSGFLGPLAA